MTKRRVNQQQIARIKKIQASAISNLESSQHQHQEGLVLSRFGRHADIETKDNRLILCNIRPNIDSLVAGDKVIWQTTAMQQGVVLSRFPRQSELSKSDKRGNIRPVAANITQLMIVVAPKPELSFSLLDNYLLIAHHLGVQASIVLNKIDIPCEDIKSKLLDIYEQQLHYPVLLTSKNLTGYDDLKRALIDHVSVFVGQSGVGKSSLISSILPHETNIITQAISTQSELGKHTTSNSRFYHLPQGGALIDSPGVREFTLPPLSSSDILGGFKDIKAYAEQCKFRNCEHQHSPGCAVLKALQSKLIAEHRYQHFLALSYQIKAPNRT